jgi:hypothetical protein
VKTKILAAAIGAAALLGAAAPASATTYYLNAFDTAFVPPLGTVEVTGQGTATLSFSVQLSPNVFFQVPGNNAFDDAFWFDLTGINGTAVTYNITSPNADGVAPGGDYPTGGLFQGAAFSNNAYGQGFSKNYDYAVQVRDNQGGVQYFNGPLNFSVTATGGGALDLASRVINVGGSNTTVFGGADLRQCPVGGGACTTGPVAFTLTQTPGVPEPAAWAMMIMGFGAVGALMRRRRYAYAVA